MLSEPFYLREDDPPPFPECEPPSIDDPPPFPGWEPPSIDDPPPFPGWEPPLHGDDPPFPFDEPPPFPDIIMGPMPHELEKWDGVYLRRKGDHRAPSLKHHAPVFAEVARPGMYWTPHDRLIQILSPEEIVRRVNFPDRSWRRERNPVAYEAETTCTSYREPLQGWIPGDYPLYPVDPVDPVEEL